MNDRSVHAGDMHQSVFVTGDGNKVVLRFGKADDITVLERTQFPASRTPSAACSRPTPARTRLARARSGDANAVSTTMGSRRQSRTGHPPGLLAELNVSERGKFMTMLGVLIFVS